MMTERASPDASRPYGVPVTLADAVPTPAPTPRKPRRRAAALAGTVAVAAIVGGGAWAWHAWSAQGPQPAEVLPGNTLAYVAVDLDPPGRQKVAAYDALRKFPTLKKQLHLGSTDDLRRSLVEDVVSEDGCELDFDEIEKWAGDRAALAVVPHDEPTPVVVLQVSDDDAARTGLEKIGKACADDDFGFTLRDGWAVVAETEAIAEQVRSDAERGTLADHADYQELVGASGDPGVLTMYAAPEAGKALLDMIEEDPFFSLFAFLPVTALDPVTTMISFGTFFADLDLDLDEEVGKEYEPTPEEEALFERMEKYDSLSPAEQKKLDAELEALWDEDEGAFGDSPAEVPAELRKALEDFSGLGGTVRFEDGGLEAEIVSDPVLSGYDEVYDGADAYDALAALPADTAIAFGGGFREGWGAKAVERSQAFSLSEEEDPVKAFEKSTGLTPADLETLGGDTIAIAAGKDFAKDPDAPASKVAVAVRITGDAAKIEKVLAKLRSEHGLEDVRSVRFDGGIVIGPNPAYLEQVADPGKTLGGTDHFEDAVDGEKDAQAITYADLDAGRWLEDLSEGDLSSGDVEPLGTASIVASEDGSRERQVIRVSLD